MKTHRLIQILGATIGLIGMRCIGISRAVAGTRSARARAAPRPRAVTGFRAGARRARPVRPGSRFIAWNGTTAAHAFFARPAMREPGFVYLAAVDQPQRPLCIDGPLSSACTADVPEPTPPARRPAERPERSWRFGPKPPSPVPHPWPSWAPVAATAVPHRLRHIVSVMRRIEVDWLISASMPCNVVPDVDDPAVELALMILDG